MCSKESEGSLQERDNHNAYRKLLWKQEGNKGGILRKERSNKETEERFCEKSTAQYCHEFMLLHMCFGCGDHVTVIEPLPSHGRV
jgi:hypothetical protein